MVQEGCTPAKYKERSGLDEFHSEDWVKIHQKTNRNSARGGGRRHKKKWRKAAKNESRERSVESAPKQWRHFRPVVLNNNAGPGTKKLGKRTHGGMDPRGKKKSARPPRARTANGAMIVRKQSRLRGGAKGTVKICGGKGRTP